MKALSWNELGHPRAINRVSNKLRYVLPQILFLIQTKLIARRMEQVRRKCGYVNGIDVGVHGSRGGLLLRWRSDCVVQFKSFSSSHIDVKIHKGNGLSS
ncbi:hypothetical protein PVK06_028638 [Gossypium arboreum]|uniref:Uncharacterized protein n=1 Tax=Gossypium arboreum TaxID=29729 RepID=A0ABR0P455_GOSAR|nr:hypothetical protein PVK06_028638 [Gossypium arboreum]